MLLPHGGMTGSRGTDVKKGLEALKSRGEPCFHTEPIGQEQAPRLP
jgi:hypothetical protein